MEAKFLIGFLIGTIGLTCLNFCASKIDTEESERQQLEATISNPAGEDSSMINERPPKELIYIYIDGHIYIIPIIKDRPKENLKINQNNK